MSDIAAKADTSPARLLRFDRHPRVAGQEGSDNWCCFAFQDAMRRVEAEVYGAPGAEPRLMTA